MLDNSPEPQKQAKDEAQSVRDTAFRLLARREHSQCELLRKLKEKGFSPEVCDSVVKQLSADGYQSQSRFTEMWVKNRAAKYYGENKIRSELSQHEIPSGLVTEMLKDVEIDWFELCLLAYQKKFGLRKKTGSNSANDWAVKQKQKRHLWQRGFTEEQIAYALSTPED